MHEDEDTASDSGIDTDMDSDYTSVASTNYQFRQEAGRRCDPQVRAFEYCPLSMCLDGDDVRFHGFDAPYLLPNDNEEEERLQDLQNYHKAFFGTNILAPIHHKPTLIGTIPEMISRNRTEN